MKYLIKYQTECNNELDEQSRKTYIGPLFKGARVFLPGYLYADGVAFHAIEVRIPRRCTIKELSPKDLSM